MHGVWRSQRLLLVFLCAHVTSHVAGLFGIYQRLPIRQGRSRAIIQLFMPITIRIINFFLVYFMTNEIIVWYLVVGKQQALGHLLCLLQADQLLR